MRIFCPRCRHTIQATDVAKLSCPACGLLVDLAQAGTQPGSDDGPRGVVLPFGLTRDLSGERVGAYELQRCLGAGGMGTVYLAKEMRQGRAVALKVLAPALAAQLDLVERFHREARALAKLDHPRIVKFIEAGQAEGLHFLAMEYVDGPDLERFLRERDPGPAEVVDIALQITEALEAAHGCGVVHRDLKPANVVISAQGVKVLDFGIAHLALEEHTLTHSDAVLGSFNYMAPEQRVGAREVDSRADLFALGVIIYRMLTGQLPIGSFEPASRLNRAVSKEIDRIVQRALQHDPKRRYQQAAELARDLRALARGHRVRWPVLAAAMVVALLGLGAWGMMLDPPARWAREAEPQAPAAEPAQEPAQAKPSPLEAQPQQQQAEPGDLIQQAAPEEQALQQAMPNTFTNQKGNTLNQALLEPELGASNAPTQAPSREAGGLGSRGTAAKSADRLEQETPLYAKLGARKPTGTLPAGTALTSRKPLKTKNGLWYAVVTEDDQRGFIRAVAPRGTTKPKRKNVKTTSAK